MTVAVTCFFRHCDATFVPFKPRRGRPSKYCPKHRDYSARHVRRVFIPSPTLPPFMPATFDDALARGRLFYDAGRDGRPYPSTPFRISVGDLASFSLGARHRRANGAATHAR